MSPPGRGGTDDEESCISIEIVREKLKSNHFKDIAEFDDEMQTLFQAWIHANSKQHKYYKTYQSIVDRFTKQIKRAK